MVVIEKQMFKALVKVTEDWVGDGSGLDLLNVSDQFSSFVFA